MNSKQASFSVLDMFFMVQVGEWDNVYIGIEPADDNGFESDKDSRDEDFGGKHLWSHLIKFFHRSIHPFMLYVFIYLCFSGSINNLNSKQLTAKASFTAYKHGKWVEHSDECSDNYENVENESLDISSNERETIIFSDFLPRKWSKKGIPINQQ